MQYLLLIHDEEDVWENLSEEQRNEIYGRYMAYTNELRESGALVGANQLQPTSTATTVRVRDGETLLTDGPFAEIKERLGGYYVLDCADLDEAVKWAAAIPTVSKRGASIEIRPLIEFGAGR